MRYAKKGLHTLSADSLHLYYNQCLHDGTMGTLFNVDMRALIERYYPSSRPHSDCILPNGDTIDIKSASCWLMSPYYREPDHARTAFQSQPNPMGYASHIIYLPKYDGCNLFDARIYTQSEFLHIVDTMNAWYITSNSSAIDKRYGAKIKPIRAKAGEKFQLTLKSCGLPIVEYLRGYTD